MSNARGHTALSMLLGLPMAVGVDKPTREPSDRFKRACADILDRKAKNAAKRARRAARAGHTPTREPQP